MRIAFVSNLFPPIQTGSAYWTAQAAAALAARGHHVVVITCAPGARTEQIDDAEGVRVYRLPAVFRLPRWSLFLKFDQFYLMSGSKNARRFSEILRDERIEVMHQAGQLLDSMMLSSAAARTLAIPAVCSIHTRIGHPTSIIFDRLLRTIDRVFVGRFVMRRYVRIVALDQVLLRHYERVYRRRGIVCVPVCVDDEILQRAAAPLADGSPVSIVSVGHVTAMRDRRELLAAIAELKSRGLAIHLDIVGKILTDITSRLIAELGLDDTVTLVGELP